MDVEKKKLPLCVSVRLSPPLFWRKSVAPLASPLSEPPTLNLLVVQLTRMLVTSAAPTLPLPFVTVQVWLMGWVGCDETVTAYVAPLSMLVGKTKLPLAVI